MIMLHVRYHCKNILFASVRNVQGVILLRKGFISNLYCTVNNLPSRSTASTNIYVQVLQPGGRDASGSLYIFTDFKRYLINAGENTLRHLRVSGHPVNRLDKIFLTGSTLNHIGGLINTLLATQDRKTVPELPINVYGPHNLDAYMHTTRQSFEYLSKFDFVKLCSINERTSFQEVLNDENFKIQACAVTDTLSQSEGNSIYPRLAISFLFELHQAQRIFSTDNAEKLGISNKMFDVVAKECQMGESVTLPSGKVITPDDVLLAQEPKQSFLVIDCPSQHVLKTLKQRIQPSKDPHLDIDVIVHLTPLEIAQSHEYTSWISQFDRRVKHILLNDSNSLSPPFSGFNKIYDNLTTKHPLIFPPLSSSVTNSETLKNIGFPGNVLAGCTSLKHVFRPHTLEGFEETTPEKTLIGCGRNQGATFDNTLNKQNNFEVVFLGTGARVSSILRNTSGILLNMSGNVSLLMDCGEGTYRQMCQHYGNDVDKILKQLRTVFISHMHIDHHLGLANILLQRKKLVGCTNFVRIIGPESLDLFLRYFEMLSGETLNFRFTQFWWLKRERGKKEERAFSKSLGLSSIAVVPTIHSDYSHGIVLERNGWKIVYSADTRPSKKLIDAGSGATLLIHEATFNDNLIERAKAVYHCTASEAIRTSELMKAQHTILTHISDRHLFPCRISRLPNGVSFALDHLTIQQKDLPTLHGMMPGIESALRDSLQASAYARGKRKK